MYLRFSPSSNTLEQKPHRWTRAGSGIRIPQIFMKTWIPHRSPCCAWACSRNRLLDLIKILKLDPHNDTVRSTGLVSAAEHLNEFSGLHLGKTFESAFPLGNGVQRLGLSGNDMDRSTDEFLFLPARQSHRFFNPLREI